MAEWLSIIGCGEDGLAGLAEASLVALHRSEIVFGSPRLLDKLTHGDKRAWPVPFALGPLLALRGHRVAVLVSGDPFWHGAGGTLARELDPGEWRAYPAASSLSLAAARLGWRLEEVEAIALHAAPFVRLRPKLSPGARLIVTLRDGKAPAALAEWLTGQGYGSSRLHVMEHLGGAEERLTSCLAGDRLPVTADLVLCAIELGQGPVIGRASGRSDDLFAHDGQITRRPVRALALSALAPRGGEMLWDLGAGSGSVGLEWLLSDGRNRCTAVERDPARAARARANAEALGVTGYDLREGTALQLLAALPAPDAVFVGGGMDAPLLAALWDRLAEGTRLVVHAVTLETEALLLEAHGRLGGSLLRIELAEAAPLGPRRGWTSARPILQWSTQR